MPGYKPNHVYSYGFLFLYDGGRVRPNWQKIIGVSVYVVYLWAHRGSTGGFH